MAHHLSSMYIKPPYNLHMSLGTRMHMDPEYTDAFNALIRGEKWWVTLPKDLYEFNDEFTCDLQCSVEVNNFSNISIWYTHMLPQIRYVRTA